MKFNYFSILTLFFITQLCFGESFSIETTFKQSLHKIHQSKNLKDKLQLLTTFKKTVDQKWRELDQKPTAKVKKELDLVIGLKSFLEQIEEEHFKKENCQQILDSVIAAHDPTLKKKSSELPKHVKMTLQLVSALCND